MKTIFKTLLAGITATLILTGCGGANQPVLATLPKIEKNENGIIIIKQSVNKFSDEVKGNSPFEEYTKAYKIGMNSVFEKASKETLSQGKTHFIVIDKITNGLEGFPLTKVNDIAEYCLGNYLTKELKNKCKEDSLIDFRTNIITLKVLPLNNPDYTIPAFDAKLVLEEIK